MEGGREPKGEMERGRVMASRVMERGEGGKGDGERERRRDEGGGRKASQ